MAKVKAGGSAKNLTDSNPKYLGVKLTEGQEAKSGSIIVRQRGTKFIAGENTRVGNDHTVYSTAAGVVKFKNKRITSFTGKSELRKMVSVVSPTPAAATTSAK